MRIATELAGRDFEHVIPFLDAGQDAQSDSYFTVMPRAEKSLRDEIEGCGMLPENEAAEVLRQIVQGLLEVPEITHRDLKPGNVLFHNGNWKVADFGIARFVEDSTSLQTLRDCLTPLYAAPEQWRLERATAATDTYALGCIAYELLAGRPPFEGNTREELRRQHLEEPPPSLQNATPQMRQLVGMLMRKTPAARPSHERILTLLQRIMEQQPQPSDAGGSGLDELARAAAEIVQKRAAEEAVAAEHSARWEERRALAMEAKEILRGVFDELCARITEAVAEARCSRESDVLKIHAAGAVLEIDLRSEWVISRDEFPQSEWDVVTGAFIGVEQREPRYDWNTSLWYTNLRSRRDYRWYEVAYETHAFSSHRAEYEPFALRPEDADRAAGPAMGDVTIAYGPEPIDDENVDSFCDRWARLLAAASRGQLRYPPNYSLIR